MKIVLAFDDSNPTVHSDRGGVVKEVLRLFPGAFEWYNGDRELRELWETGSQPFNTGELRIEFWDEETETPISFENEAVRALMLD